MIKEQKHHCVIRVPVPVLNREALNILNFQNKTRLIQPTSTTNNMTDYT